MSEKPPLSSLREEVFAYARRVYRTEPEYLWQRYPDYAVLRRPDDRKWYALIGGVPRDKLGLEGSERVDVVNVKTGDEMLSDFLAGQKGYAPAYHMHKKNWVSVLLDGSVPFAEITALLDQSYQAAAAGRGRHS